jgi:hypothetical protein
MLWSFVQSICYQDRKNGKYSSSQHGNLNSIILHIGDKILFRKIQVNKQKKHEMVKLEYGCGRHDLMKSNCIVRLNNEAKKQTSVQ